ncbi:hypothetical protein E2C01_077443 [Portunus trituberculatus]|uniref:Uncharacterized protein n=1 Tax=Portunus trituberculatus TaxID=210409 RepID=A0A5B7IBG1_PORTR|nr:hypothetical protein [Portunus trituberculatus]
MTFPIPNTSQKIPPLPPQTSQLTPLPTSTPHNSQDSLTQPLTANSPSSITSPHYKTPIPHPNTSQEIAFTHTAPHNSAYHPSPHKQ